MGEYILETNNISKEFSGVKALSGIDFKVRKGEIHCLVGENGAGKSTLMKVLSGVYPYGTYSGDIIIEDEIRKFATIGDSQKAGVAIIYQELSLFPELSVYENIFVGHELKKGMFVDWNEAIAKTSQLLKMVNLNISPETKIKDLGVGQQQLVEIVKSLSQNANILILDEPTAALNEDDSENLLSIIKDLQQKGITCIMISHKLKEVIKIADTVTVFRDGKTICSLCKEKNEINEKVIIKHMVGREIDDIYPRLVVKNLGDKMLEISDWTVYDPKLGRQILTNINLNVKKGEILGIVGLMGSGRTELAQSIFGNPQKYKIKGKLIIDGKRCNFSHPRDAIKSGLAYVSEDRKGDGLILMQDIRDNITITNLESIAEAGIINQNEATLVASKYLKDMTIKAPHISQIVGKLSGGNQQKVALSKWLFTDPKVLILDEPTRGIDVGAKYEIYTIMNKLVEQGMSIIMISSELPEVLGMSDRIYVMANGKVTGELMRKEATQEKVMEFATAE